VKKRGPTTEETEKNESAADRSLSQVRKVHGGKEHRSGSSEWSKKKRKDRRRANQS